MLINNKKGNIILVRRTVKENFSGVARKPGAITVTIAGVKIIPRTHINPTKSKRKVKVIPTNFLASSCPAFVRYSVRTGTKAEDIAPSANNSLKRLGILKATKKVSAVPVAPKIPARSMSFTYPRTRLIKVATDIRPAAFAIRLFSSAGFID
jgi:hypothetical protein